MVQWHAVRCALERVWSRSFDIAIHGETCVHYWDLYPFAGVGERLVDNPLRLL